MYEDQSFLVLMIRLKLWDNPGFDPPMRFCALWQKIKFIGIEFGTEPRLSQISIYASNWKNFLCASLIII